MLLLLLAQFWEIREIVVSDKLSAHQAVELRSVISAIPGTDTCWPSRPARVRWRWPAILTQVLPVQPPSHPRQSVP